MEINKVYNAENLEFLKQIPDNFIDLIYCDILYGTGRNFGDYQDLKCDKKIIEGHYLPRLIEMKRVLKDTGSIYLQMDTRINHWLRCLMDDIFGYHNFRNEIVWCYKTIGQGKYFLKKHDVLLFYSKKNPIFCKQKHKPSDNYKKRFGYVADEDGNIPYNKLTPYAQKMYKEENYRKNPMNIYSGSYLRDWWDDILEVSRGGNTEIKFNKYFSQKPKALLERIIKASSNEGDLVADFYMGSGTSMVVAKELKRNFIGCDISEKAVEITEKRLKEVKHKIF